MTNAIDPTNLLSNNQSQAKTSGSSSLGKDDFLKILMTQLQNQDPLNPMQDQDFIAQMATFSTLEQITNMNSSIDKLVTLDQQNKLLEYNQLIGKEVSWTKTSDSGDGTTQTGSGKVVSVQMQDGAAQLTLEDGTIVDPANISKVNEVTAENQVNQAAQMIGKTVTYLNDHGVETTAKVKSVLFKDGKSTFQLDDTLNSTITASQITKIE